jgi:hypothetical protein
LYDGTQPLRRLDLRYNAIGPAGLRALAAGMAAAEALPELHMHVQSNKYADRDAADLADEMDADARFAPLVHGRERFWF